MPNRNTAPILLDSSVILKWFLNEDGAKEAIQYRKDSKREKIDVAIAEFSFYEVANVLRFNKNMTQENVHRAIHDVAEAGLPILPFDITAMHIAIENAYEYDISIYDAYFVAQADLEGMRLVTADNRLADKVAHRSDVITL
jgi:predicted nucleic acid-binding protein